MRLEIVIPDNTLPELKAWWADLTPQLGAEPELVSRMHFEVDDEAAIQGMFCSQRLAHIDAGIAEVKSGNFFTEAQVEEHFARPQ